MSEAHAAMLACTVTWAHGGIQVWTTAGVVMGPNMMLVGYDGAAPWESHLTFPPRLPHNGRPMTWMYTAKNWQPKVSVNTQQCPSYQVLCFGSALSSTVLCASTPALSCWYWFGRFWNCWEVVSSRKKQVIGDRPLWVFCPWLLPVSLLISRATKV